MSVEDTGEKIPRVRKYLSSENCYGKELEKDIVGDVSQNLHNLLGKITDDNGSVKRRVRHLNSLAKIIRHAGPDSPDVKCRIWQILENLRFALCFMAKEVRAGALRVFRYVLTSREVFEIMLKLHVDFLVARSVDVPPLRDIERLQAMRLIRQVVMVCPQRLPPSLVAPLVSIVLCDSEPLDNLTWSSLATLSEIALINPQLSCQCSVVQALLRGLLKCQTPRVSETIVFTLTHLLNRPESRQYIRPHLDVQSLLAPITDLHYRYLIEEVESSYTKPDREKRIEAAKMAVTALFKSWPGIISLCSFETCGISAFVKMLPLVESFAQKEMLDVVFDVFQLKVPVWTEDYKEAVASIDPSQYCDEWSLDSGWVAEEGKALLPPKAMERVNLLDCYNAFLLVCFVDSGLFKSLVEVVKVSEPSISVMATILIGELLHLANSVLPAEYLGFSLSLPDLIASAMAFDSQAERNRASEVINCLNQVHQLKKENVKPSSLYLKLTLEQTGYFSGKGSPDTQIMKSVFVPTEMDEMTLLNHIRDTQVLLAVREFQSWNWNLIFSLLQHPYLSTVTITEDNMLGRFIRILTNFYKPNNRQFSSIVFSNKHSRKYSLVGLQLVKFLSKMESSEDGLLIGLVTDIVEQLGQVTASKLTSDVFSPSSVSHKLTRDYFLLLGAVSFHNNVVLKQCKAYGPLLDICGISSRHDLHKLIVASLDFAHDVQARVILEKLLTGGDEETRIYATRHMRVFLRVNAPFFISWGMEMLIGQLYDLSSEVAEEAIDILDEACEEESFLDVLVLQQPALLHLSEKGVSLFTRFVSVKRGYLMLSELGHLTTELDTWLEDYNFRYVAVVEQRLAESLTFFRRTQEGVYHRRSELCATVHKAFVPVHFYGQLVRQEEGCRLLRAEGHIQKLSNLLRQEPTTAEKICQTKAAIWALGHIGTSAGGLILLMENDLIFSLVMTAQTSLVLSIRGTCYYALCLISKTSQGADILLSVGWTSVRHSREEKWPVRLEEAIVEIATPSSPISPTSSSTSLGSHQECLDQQQLESSPLRSSSLVTVDGNLPSSHSSTSIGRNFSSPAIYGLPGKKGSLISKSYHLRSLRPISLNPSDQMDSPSSSLDSTRSNVHRSSLIPTNKGFVGVALPLELQTFFEFVNSCEDSYIGSRARSVSTELFDKDHHFILQDSSRRTTPCIKLATTEPTSSSSNKLEPDNDEETVRSSSPLIRQKRLKSQSQDTSPTNTDQDMLQRQLEPTEEAVDPAKPHPASLVSRSSISSSTSAGSVAFDENSPDGKKLLHRECLEVIYNLCSDVSLKKNTIHLNILFEKFPSLYQDVDLYWKVMLLLSTYPYKLDCRRFIQSKFEDLSFEKLASSGKDIKGTYLHHQDLSPKMRRRSSTSDIGRREAEEEKADTKSVTTTVSEQDEDNTSISSNDMLDWRDEKCTPIVSPEDEDKEEGGGVEFRTNKSVAEKGNRLSQLDIPESSSRENRIESIVEIAYDL